MNTASQLLKFKCSHIMNLWEERTVKEVKAAMLKETLALRNTLPEFILHLSDALSETIDRNEVRIKIDKDKSARLGKIHGRERATSFNYTLDQLIFEYHILRQVIFDVMEKELELKPLEREIIVCAIEQAVNDAATEFSDFLRNIQQRFTQTLAHDFRGPITVTKTSAELVKKKPNDLENLRKQINRIVNQMDRLDKMIRDLLDASRIRAGESLPVEFENCNLTEIIREVATEVNLVSKDLVKVKSEQECFGKWDGNGLRRVIENLVNNAIKYGEMDKPIIITVKQDEKSVVVDVHNQGNPIPKDEQEILFQQFKRSKEVENKSTGWGIGLSIVQEIIKSHCGSVKVESSIGKGTSFIVTLPKLNEVAKFYNYSSL